MLRANLLSYTRNLGGAIYILSEASVICSNQNKDVPQHIVILASSSHPAFLLIFFFLFKSASPFKIASLVPHWECAGSWKCSEMESCDPRTSGSHNLEKSQCKSKFILKVTSSLGGSLLPELGYQRTGLPKWTRKEPKFSPHSWIWCVSITRASDEKVGYLKCGCHLLMVTMMFEKVPLIFSKHYSPDTRNTWATQIPLPAKLRG